MKVHHFIFAAAVFFLLGLMMTKQVDVAKAEGNSGFSICLTTDKTEYTVGEPIRMTITAINHTSSEVCLSFRDAQRFDFHIERKGNEVWRWSQGRMFAQVLGQEVLAPGTSLTFSAKCHDKCELGLYHVTGIIPADPTPFVARINIVIR